MCSLCTFSHLYISGYTNRASGWYAEFWKIFRGLNTVALVAITVTAVQASNNNHYIYTDTTTTKKVTTFLVNKLILA